MGYGDAYPPDKVIIYCGALDAPVEQMSRTSDHPAHGPDDAALEAQLRQLALSPAWVRIL